MIWFGKKRVNSNIKQFSRCYELAFNILYVLFTKSKSLFILHINYVYCTNQISIGTNSANETDFHVCITSYDFDAPLTEAGDPTQKYYDIRDVVKNVSKVSCYLTIKKQILKKI